MRRFKRKLKKIKAEVLLINITGVLADCGWTFHRKVIKEVFESKGIKIRDKQVVDTCGLPLCQQIIKLLNNKNVLAEWVKVFKSKPDQTTYNELNIAITTKILEVISQDEYFIPDVKNRINKLYKKGYKIILITEYNIDIAKLLEDRFREMEYNFHKIYTYDDFNADYPHPLLCYKIAIDLNKFPIETFVRIGDTKYHNIEAYYADAWAISTLTTGPFSGLDKIKLKKKGRLKSDKKIKAISKKLKRSGAHYTISTFDEIMWVLEDINYRLSKHELPNCLL